MASNDSPAASSSIIRNLQIVFSISTVLLLISLGSSFYSTQQLIESSWWVNHTNEVIIETENIISAVKDAETGQRGYLLTLDNEFLEPYKSAYEKASGAISKVRDLTVDNQVQQKNIVEIKVLVDERFEQMQKIIDDAVVNTKHTSKDTLGRYTELMKGKRMMDNLRALVNRMKNEENRLMVIRTKELSRFANFTPILVVLAALISILITIFSYVKIKKDVDERAKKQKEDEDRYAETSERINVMEGITQKISQGDYAVRSPDKKDDELGRVSGALNDMASSLETNFNILKNKAWQQEGAVKINDAVRGERDIKKLSTNIINGIQNTLTRQ